MVDKNLFLYDLAVVAIMKDEDPYVKEWIDYHLLAGVDHFYIYDNDSTPEFKKILQPYIDAKIVTYTPIPGKAQQMAAYNDAVKRFRFESRYIAFLDADEFIFPKSKPTVTEILDETLSKLPRAAGLSIKWMFYGSSGHEKADYTQGVLDRFTKRDANLNGSIKSILNPRSIDFFWTPHFPNFFDETVFALSDEIAAQLKLDNISEKIVLNHYHTKSREEYENKNKRGDVAFNKDGKYGDGLFKILDRNDVDDDGIVKYRDARRAALIPQGRGCDALFPRKQINPQKLFNALAQSLITTTVAAMPRNFYDEKIENFLTCLHLSGYLRGKLLDDEGAKIFEELSLNALYKSLQARVSATDILLLLDEMPTILDFKNTVVKKICALEIELIKSFSKNLMSVIKEDKDLRFWRLICRLQKASEMLKVVI